MNKFQRIATITIGVLIAVIQLVGIVDRGLDDNKGWAVSLLISAFLLFVGFGSWSRFLGHPQPPPSLQRESSATAPVTPAPKPKNQAATAPLKYTYGVHISELDIAIEATKRYIEQQKIYVSIAGNGRSLNWNCCAVVYASMRLAAQKAELKIHASIWNTIKRSIVMRMAAEEVEGVGMGDPEFGRLETAASDTTSSLDEAVEDALEGKGSIEPIVFALADMLGTSDEQAVNALSALVVINAQKAHEKILPEYLADLV